MWQSKSFPFRSSSKQERSHRSRKSGTNSLNITLEDLHRIVNCQSGINFSTRRIDVHDDIFLRIFLFQIEHLRYDRIDHRTMYLLSHENNSIFKESWVNIVSSFSIFGFFKDGRNKGHSFHFKKNKILIQSKVLC